MAISFNNLGNYGSLGNQMFQYASVRGIAKENGYDFCIPEKGHRLFNVFEMSGCVNRHENKNLIHEATPKSFNFDLELFEGCKDNTDLFGYFQSEKYFYNISDSIKEDFTFKNINDEIIDGLKNQAAGKDIVSIHVRRGDYVFLQEYHPLVSENFYSSAKKLFNDVLFAVFSDDILWCQNQKVFQDCVFIDAGDKESLYTMTKCDHNIIANSSFSWWAAWLNNNYQKVVIAPKQWFGPAYSDYDTSDLFPARWIVI